MQAIWATKPDFKLGKVTFSERGVFPVSVGFELLPLLTLSGLPEFRTAVDACLMARKRTRCNRHT